MLLTPRFKSEKNKNYNGLIQSAKVIATKINLNELKKNKSYIFFVFSIEWGSRNQI